MPKNSDKNGEKLVEINIKIADKTEKPELKIKAKTEKIHSKGEKTNSRNEKHDKMHTYRHDKPEKLYKPDKHDKHIDLTPKLNPLLQI